MRYFWGESESVYGESEIFLFSFLHYLCGMPAPVPSCALLRSNEWDISGGKVKVYMVKVKGFFYFVFCIICVVWLLHAPVPSCVLLRSNEWYISRVKVKVYMVKVNVLYLVFCIICVVCMLQVPAVSSLEVMNKRFSTREFFFRGTTTVFSILVMHCLS